jgi:hypothetical protein
MRTDIPNTRCVVVCLGLSCLACLACSGPWTRRSPGLSSVSAPSHSGVFFDDFSYANQETRMPSTSRVFKKCP